MVQTPKNVGLLDQNQPLTQGFLLKFEFESNWGARVQVALLGTWTRMVDIKKIRPTNQHHPRRAQITCLHKIWHSLLAYTPWHHLIGTLHVSLLLGQLSFEIATAR